MKRAIYILSVLAILLCSWLFVLWLPIFNGDDKSVDETRYGVSEGLELVEQNFDAGSKKYVVEDSKGNMMFSVPLRGCIIDTRYRGGRLRFRELSTRRDGYIDRQGIVTFQDNRNVHIPEQVATGTTVRFATTNMESVHQRQNVASATTSKDNTSTLTGTTQRNLSISQVSLKAMAQSNPFYREAEKILQGKLTEQDAQCRHLILNYCEHLRTAYTTKDIDFLRQVFSDKALIIVGNVVKPMSSDGKCIAEPRVTYAIHSKQAYLTRLAKVFATNRKIDVRFSDFRILRHPTMDGIYGVTLRQCYNSERYSDEGYLFLLWDFRDRSMPLIHVRTWQPSSSVSDDEDVISIQDFNLQ